MSNYTKYQERARDDAIEWQSEGAELAYTYSELAEWAGHFYKLGKRYGIIKEFRESGIL